MVKRTVAIALSLALVITSVAVVKLTNNVSADSTVTLVPWSFYEGAASFRSGEDPWAQRFYSSVKVGDETIGNWGSSDEVTQEMTQTATAPADNFTANIVTTGWDGDYSQSPAGDNPWLLRGTMTDIPMQQAHNYSLSFKAKWTNSKDAPEKNVQVALVNEYGESIFKDYPLQETKITIPTGSTVNYSFDFCLYAGNTLTVELAMGAFLASAREGLTTEKTNASGKLEVTEFKIEDKGLNPDVPTDPPKPTTTQAPTQAPTVAPQPTQAPTVKPAPAKTLAKVTKVKVKSVKKKTIKVTWKKVANAKSYQIKVGNKTYKATKNSKKIKNKKFKKGKKVKVKVRAMAAGYKTGAWSKTVKKKLTK